MPATVPAIDKALANNNFALAHILYWEWTQREQHEALANEYLKRICEGFGFTPNFRIGGPKAEANASVGTDASGTHRNDRYHLIHAWGFGFWSDVNHVVIQAMLAEMLGKPSVVYLGKIRTVNPYNYQI
jgi:hypothetical protein